MYFVPVSPEVNENGRVRLRYAVRPSQHAVKKESCERHGRRTCSTSASHESEPTSTVVPVALARANAPRRARNGCCLRSLPCLCATQALPRTAITYVRKWQRSDMHGARLPAHAQHHRSQYLFVWVDFSVIQKHGLPEPEQISTSMPMSVFASIHSDNQVEHPLLLLFTAKKGPVEPHRDVITRDMMDRTRCVDGALLAIYALASFSGRARFSFAPEGRTTPLDSTELCSVPSRTSQPGIHHPWCTDHMHQTRVHRSSLTHRFADSEWSHGADKEKQSRAVGERKD